MNGSYPIGFPCWFQATCEHQGSHAHNGLQGLNISPAYRFSFVCNTEPGQKLSNFDVFISFSALRLWLPGNSEHNLYLQPCQWKLKEFSALICSHRSQILCDVRYIMMLCIKMEVQGDSLGCNFFTDHCLWLIWKAALHIINGFWP